MGMGGCRGRPEEPGGAAARRELPACATEFSSASNPLISQIISARNANYTGIAAHSCSDANALTVSP